MELKQGFIYKKTLKAKEAKGFIRSVEEVSREARMIERGIHGGGCPYPIKKRWYDIFFDWP